MTSSDKSPEPLRAAGGLLWRGPASARQIAIVHRPRYDDWTLPKGKPAPGESWSETARREVREETGYEPHLLAFAGAVVYMVNDRPKTVCYWHMEAAGGPVAEPDDEVSQLAWLSPEEAEQRLDYPVERALLDVWHSGPTPPAAD